MKTKIDTGGARILLLDLETAPNRSYTWGLWDQNIGVSQLIKAGYVLCWAAKWLGTNTIMSDSLVDHPKMYKADPENDVEIAKSMWKLLDEADIVIAHNGDSFDLKWLNTLFITHKLPPPSTFLSIDTLKSARRYFRFASNKLQYITKHLGLQEKLHHDGFDLWIRVMAGHKQSWKHMIKYCKQDIVALEELYLVLKPYISNHPNLGLYREFKSSVCPNCVSKKIKKRGFSYTAKKKYQRYKCLKCGRSWRGGAV